jgi:hypothetical protein
MGLISDAGIIFVINSAIFQEKESTWCYTVRTFNLLERNLDLMHIQTLPYEYTHPTLTQKERKPRLDAPSHLKSLHQ